MRSMEEIYEELDRLIGRSRWEEIEPFLRARMEEAKEEEQNGIYVAAGNELLSFYRQSGQYEKAFAVSEDLLLLLEELNLEDTEHFALILMSTGAACEGAERPQEAESYYARAVRILEGKGKSELLLAEALTRQGILLVARSREAAEKEKLRQKAKRLLLQAEALFEECRKRRKASGGNSEGDSCTRQEEDGQEEVYYLTALSGLGEICWCEKDYEGALAFYEKAGQNSRSFSGESEGTRLFWNNCAAVCAVLKDPEKEAYYRTLAGEHAQDAGRRK
ncbi:MAG TPA: hypothetical protein H9700_11885 [Candidatus Eisenbergiella intestinipullorum]|nr:hypothetical protein [Candidatus Eisenbergiella intestinipullorum]